MIRKTSRRDGHCWSVIGPTAVGKTALSLHLAGRYRGMIISADSRQIYRGMDIGTAKTDYRRAKPGAPCLDRYRRSRRSLWPGPVPGAGHGGDCRRAPRWTAADVGRRHGPVRPRRSGGVGAFHGCRPRTICGPNLAREAERDGSDALQPPAGRGRRRRPRRVSIRATCAASSGR